MASSRGRRVTLEPEQMANIGAPCRITVISGENLRVLPDHEEFKVVNALRGEKVGVALKPKDGPRTFNAPIVMINTSIVEYATIIVEQ